ncbi:hypothetical protein OTU49_010687 [Cherax quadricarinatus]|uniref:Uncharacterized protein n=1 Tax=Cherax quadricarinatus TaxID=27406 RepID=A0AAW0WEJ3_CHEQU
MPISHPTPLLHLSLTPPLHPQYPHTHHHPPSTTAPIFTPIPPSPTFIATAPIFTPTPPTITPLPLTCLPPTVTYTINSPALPTLKIPALTNCLLPSTCR